MSAEYNVENIPPGYKQTEVGVIPEDWEVSLLDSVTKRGSGHTPDKMHPEYWGGNIKWISLQDSNRLDRLYIYDTAAKITPLGIKHSSAKMHLKGTVVLSRDAGVGKSAIMQEDMAVSQHFIAWECGSLLNNHFLYYWLQSSKSEFERIAMGNTIKTIGLPYFRQLAIPLPTIAEQEAIAEALSDADAFIESLEQFIAKKCQIKQSAMQELLTGKRRLPGFEIKRGYKQTEVGVIPEDWNAEVLGPNVDIKSGESPSLFRFGSDGVPYFKIEQLNSNNKYLGNTPYFFRGEKKIIRGSLIFPKRGASILLNKMRILEKDSFMDTNLMTLTPKETLHNEFLYYALTYRELWRIADTTSIPQINNKHIIPLVVALPSLSEQIAIAAILSDMDSEITALEEKLAKARQLKQGMMQELLTGRIRLM